ncbi:MAG: hypothetical protein EOM59_09040 [Clostridia bacterium]|nr:hypothetical protein [Clostridia bacterium]
MKRITALLGIILVLAIAMSPMAFASGLEIEKITPADGETGKQPQNMAVKVTFSENMMDEKAILKNKSKFKITDDEGVVQPFEIMYSAEKFPNELWLVLETTLESDTEYQVEIIPGILSATGSTLDTPMNTTFKTRNTATDAKVSLGLMGVMMLFMFSATSKSAKKAAEKSSFEESGKIKEENLNPYKLAKIKGISLEEATTYVEKEKAKIAKRQQKLEEEKRKMEAERAAEQLAIEEELKAAEGSLENYKVAKPASVKAAGGKIPKSVIKKNRERREAAKMAEKIKTNAKNKRKK